MADALPVPPPAAPSGVAALLRRIAPLEPGEARAVLWAAAFHFCLLGGYYLLRPVREAFGIERGADRLPWLMTATLGAMLLVNPLFALLVSRLPRRRFVPIVYRAVAACLLLFYGLFLMLPPAGDVALGYAFYIWLSVFNLFVVSVYWGLMADLFGRERSVRLFGFLAIGGTLGAIGGAAGAEQLLTYDWAGAGVPFGRPEMMLLAIVPLEMAARCASRLVRLFGIGDASGGSGALPRADTGEPPAGVLHGIMLVARSPYLRLICVYLFLYTLLSTYLYLEQQRIVRAAYPDPPAAVDPAALEAARRSVGNARAAAIARIDLWVNILTLATQLFFTSSILRTLGVGRALAIVPLITAAGFGALLASPTLGVVTVVQVLRRGLHYGIDRPAREGLYTVLGPEEKYKSKPFIDTFVYRGGDMIGAWTPGLLALLTIPVAAAAVPLALAWAGVGLGLGVLQRTVIRRRTGEPCARCGYDLRGLKSRPCPECGAVSAGA